MYRVNASVATSPGSCDVGLPSECYPELFNDPATQHTIQIQTSSDICAVEPIGEIQCCLEGMYGFSASNEACCLAAGGLLGICGSGICPPGTNESACCVSEGCVSCGCEECVYGDGIWFENQTCPLDSICPAVGATTGTTGVVAAVTTGTTGTTGVATTGTPEPIVFGACCFTCTGVAYGGCVSNLPESECDAYLSAATSDCANVPNTVFSGAFMPGVDCVNAAECPYCGDTVVSPGLGEECDDGNIVETDACLSTCVAASCGDGYVQAGEQCDNGVSNGVIGPCTASCTINVCGDSYVWIVAEECDDGVNNGGANECTEACTIAVCGDGFVQTGIEECDGGSSNSDTGACFLNCTLSVCGDGHVATEVEECDDGNTNETDACISSCLDAVCGDGFVHAGVEECDAGANNGGSNECTTACTIAVCGDGFVRTNYEQCDDGALNNNAGDCLENCNAAICGDGFVHSTGSGTEECDDSNIDDTDACLSDCTNATCGDGFVHVGVEECDDGNTVATDHCTDVCLDAQCGDSIVWANVEECDDGPLNLDSAACTSDCVEAACGDGFVHVGVEACDDGNSETNDACQPDCTESACGDGILWLGVEDCDHGPNNGGADWCTVECTVATCGDGLLYTVSEECDNGVLNANNADCLLDCSVAFCGDGHIYNTGAGDEECDNGVSNSDSGACLVDCAIAECGDTYLWVGVEGCDDGNLNSGDGCSSTCVIETGACCGRCQTGGDTDQYFLCTDELSYFDCSVLTGDRNQDCSDNYVGGSWFWDYVEATLCISPTQCADYPALTDELEGAICCSADITAHTSCASDNVTAESCDAVGGALVASHGLRCGQITDCCLDGTTYHDVHSTCCMARGGTPSACGTHHVRGACCLGDIDGHPQCTSASPETCAAIRGSYAGDGTECGEQTTCCKDNNVFSNVADACCVTAYGGDQCTAGAVHPPGSPSTASIVRENHRILIAILVFCILIFLVIFWRNCVWRQTRRRSRNGVMNNNDPEAVPMLRSRRTD